MPAAVLVLLVALATTAARHVAPFVWPGVYDTIGTGFANGDRIAVVTVTGSDTALTLAIAGPPGRLARARFAGDSLDAEWDFGAGSEPMVLHVRGADDSLSGVWRIGDRSGPLRGWRRR